MYESYKVGELVRVTNDIEGLSNDVGIVTRETVPTKKTKIAITWVWFFGEQFEFAILNSALSRVDT